MNLPQAHDTARNGADRFGNVWRVFRMPAWPPAVYTASAKEPPPTAIVLETYPKANPQPLALSPESSTSADAQGSLF